MIMQNTLKILLTLILSLLLVLSFAACGDKDDNSSNGSSIDPTQDYADEWGEMGAPTESEKQEIEDLWNDGFSSGSGKIEGTTTSGGTSSNTSSGTSSTTSSGTTSSGTTSSSTNSDEEGTASEGELKGEVGKVNGIF